MPSAKFSTVVLLWHLVCGCVCSRTANDMRIALNSNAARSEGMSTHVVFNGCHDSIKEGLEEYWAKKMHRVEKLLVHYSPELREIRLTVYCHRQSPQREWYEARGVIHLPTGTLAAE